jgi:ribosomal protein S18 acetylase RimI-like enzyme
MDVSVFSHVPDLGSRHIHAVLTGRPHERVGPFVAAFDAHTTDIWRNYAAPDDDATPNGHDVDRTGTLDSVGELAAVGVLAHFRRRGVASAVSVYLARAADEQAVRLVWLEAAPEEEQIYARAGFIVVKQKLWISMR